MARRIRWQILVTIVSLALIFGLLGHLALSTTAQGDPVAGGTYAEALVGQVADLNPLRGALLSRPEADLTALIFEGLTRVETTGIIAPSLASAWETDSTEKAYTVTLRPDIAWHDGKPFSAEDVAWTVNWVKSPGFTGDPALQAVWSSVFVTVLDPTTVRFDLPAPFAPFANQLSMPILPAHLLQPADAAGWAAFGRKPVGTGAYSLALLEPDRAELAKNTAYRTASAPAQPIEAGQPNLDRLIFRFYPTFEEAQLALRRGDVQSLAFNVTEQGEQVLPADHQRVRAPLADYTVLTFNLRAAPLDDLKLRQALSYAISQEQVIERALGGRALPLQTPILPSSWAATDGLAGYRDTPERAAANRLLDEAGWQRDAAGVRSRKGQPLRLSLVTSDSTERQAVAAELIEQLRLVGVEVQLEAVPGDQLSARLSGHQFNLALHGWSNLGSDPDVYELWHSSQADAANFAGLADERIDELLVEARQVASLETRASLYQEFQERWLSLAPSVVLYQPLLEQQLADNIQVLGLSPQASESEVLYSRSDRFRRLANWYEVTTRQIRPNLRQDPPAQRPR